MINREMKEVRILSFAPGVDAYGQKRKTVSKARAGEMVIKIYSQRMVDDVRFVDVTNIGLTKDRTIKIGEQILFNNEKFDVLYIIPSGRLNQIFMKKV